MANQKQMVNIDAFDNLVIDVKISTKFKIRLRIAIIFLYLAAWIIGAKLEVKTDG